MYKQNLHQSSVDSSQTSHHRHSFSVKWQVTMKQADSQDHQTFSF